jgi:hypothetical protein
VFSSRLKRDGKAVGLKVDEVALGITSLAASSDVGTASLLDGDSEDGDAEAVEADQVVAGVAASELLAVTAGSGAVLRADLDLLVVVGGTALGSSEGNSSHGGDEERLEEGHCKGVGLVWKTGLKSVGSESGC